MRWCAPHYETAFERLVNGLRDATWPAPPPGFDVIGKVRPMRTVLAGEIDGPNGRERVVVKWSRPVTATDRVSKRVRGGKGPREGRVLRALASSGVRAPVALAFADDAVDCLMARRLEHDAMPPADTACAADIDAVARLLADAHAAGLRHRDLHAENLGRTPDGPALIDLGGARISDALTERQRMTELARLRHGLLGRARRTQQLRALRAYAAWLGDDARATARALAPQVERRARKIARTYRRGRDRRPTRSGRHYEHFETAQATRAVRDRDETSAVWKPWIDEVLKQAASGGCPHGAPLKDDGRVQRVDHPEGAGFVVVKAYAPVAPGRMPRPLRAFYLATALRNRHVDVVRPLVAAARADGSGVLVSEHVDAPDLHARARDGGIDEATSASIGRALRAMHESEMRHRDLKAPNLLADGSRIVIADVDGARRTKREVRWSRRARDLARLDASLDEALWDRDAMFAAYLSAPPRPPVAEDDFRALVRRHVQKKRGPSGTPR